MFGLFRFCLALAVVWEHTVAHNGVGRYAVCGFFALSGYLMTLIMQKRYGYEAAGQKAFLQNRLLRIYPTYWVVLVGCVGAIALLGESFDPFYKMTLPGNLVGWEFNTLLLVRDEAVNYAAWSLTVELFWYLAICLGISRTRGLTQGWVGASLVYAGYHALSGGLFDDFYFSISGASLPFALGSLMFWKFGRFTKWVGWAMAAVVVNFLFAINPLGPSFYINTVLMAWLVGCLAQLSPKRWDSEIGRFTYPLYLLHWPVAVFLVKLELEPGPRLLILCLALCLPLSWLLVRYVERPLERLKVSK